MTETGLFLQFIFSGLTAGAIYALVALGFCVVENSLRIVNFAQGDFLTLGGFFMSTLLTSLGLPWPIAATLTILLVGLCGVLLERLALRPARNRDPLNLIFITIGASVFLRGLIKLIWGKNPRSIPAPLSGKPLEVLGASLTRESLLVLAVGLLCVLALQGFYRASRQGKALRAVAASPRAAALIGLPVGYLTSLSFFLAGALGAVAGLLILPITGVSFDSGLILGLKGYAAAVLGGYGSFPGAIVGGLLLGVLEALVTGFISSGFRDVFAFGVLFLVLAVKPSGLLGMVEVERV